MMYALAAGHRCQDSCILEPREALAAATPGRGKPGNRQPVQAPTRDDMKFVNSAGCCLVAVLVPVLQERCRKRQCCTLSYRATAGRFCKERARYCSAQYASAGSGASWEVAATNRGHPRPSTARASPNVPVLGGTAGAGGAVVHSIQSCISPSSSSPEKVSGLHSSVCKSTRTHVCSLVKSGTITTRTCWPWPPSTNLVS